MSIGVHSWFNRLFMILRWFMSKTVRQAVGSEGAGDGRGPDDLAVDEMLDVLDHRIAMVAGLVQRGIGVGAEQHRVRAVDH